MADGLTAEAWARFYRDVLEPADDGTRLPVSENDRYKPGCNDTPSDTGPGNATIVSRFWSYASVAELTPFVNPINWPALSPYWQEMAIVSGPETTAGGGYRAVFREVVDLPTGPVTVHLDVEHEFDDHSAMTTFQELGHPDDDVEVDRGYVFVTDESISPVNPQTLVYATKAITFRKHELNEITELACDNGWVDLLITMALPAARRPAAQERMPTDVDGSGDTGPRPRAAAELDRWAMALHDLVDTVVHSTRVSARGLRRGRLDERVLDAIWKVGDDTTTAVKRGAGAWSAILSDLTRPREER